MTTEHLLLGRKGERIACRRLLREGFDILVRRWRGRQGELDIVAFEGDLLAFLEVKTRATAQYGEPWEFVDPRKQLILQRTADEFIAEYDLGQYVYRFDIVSVTGSEVTLYRNAF